MGEPWDQGLVLPGSFDEEKRLSMKMVLVEVPTPTQAFLMFNQGRWGCKCQVAGHGYSQPSFIPGVTSVDKIVTLIYRFLIYLSTTFFQETWSSFQKIVLE